MGRQLPIAMNLDDEQEFLSFLRSSAEIKIVESFAPTIEELWVENFSSALSGHWTYNIWNCEYPWSPEYGTVGKKSP